MDMREDSYRDVSRVYTDGSMLQNGKTGAALWDEKTNLIWAKRLPNKVGVFTAEAYALLKV